MKIQFFNFLPLLMINCNDLFLFTELLLVAHFQENSQSLHQEWLGTLKSLHCILNTLNESGERSLKECVVLLRMWLTALLLKLSITTDTMIYVQVKHKTNCEVRPKI